MTRYYFALCFLLACLPGAVCAQTIASFSPAAGNVGTLVTLRGTDLNLVTSVAVNGANAVILDKASTSLRLLVMPGATSGPIATTGGTPATSATPFTVTNNALGTAQQGPKLVGTGTVVRAFQGQSVALSTDGNTLAVGGHGDNNTLGAVWVFTRIGTAWSQQGPKLVGTGTIGVAFQGWSISLSADGSTLAVGGPEDNNQTGAAWVFTRIGTTWSQQGPKLVGTGAVGTARRGQSVALSADGNTLAVGGSGDNNQTGAVWVFVRGGMAWGQQSPKLVGTSTVGSAYQGVSVALSADGNTLAVGGDGDNNDIGAVWVFTRIGTAWSQQGPKLVGTGAIGVAFQGWSISLSADGNTLAVGGFRDNASVGAAWVFTRIGTTWSQQGLKLVGTGAVGTASQGGGVALSADGNTLAVSGGNDNNNTGAVWVFTRIGTAWSQQGPKLVGTGAVAGTALFSVALSADGSTLAVGGPGDNTFVGATWVFSTASSALAQRATAATERGAGFYPNPVADQLTVTGEASAGTLRVLDGTGRTLLTRPYRRGEPLPLAPLAPGSYWLRLDQGAAQPLLKQ